MYDVHCLTSKIIRGICNPRSFKNTEVSLWVLDYLIFKDSSSEAIRRQQLEEEAMTVFVVYRDAEHMPWTVRDFEQASEESPQDTHERAGEFARKLPREWHIFRSDAAVASLVQPSP